MKEMASWTPLQQKLAVALLASEEPISAENLYLACKDREVLCHAMDLLNSEDWEILNIAQPKEIKKERYDPDHPDNIRAENTRKMLISVLEGVAGKPLEEILKAGIVQK